MSRNCVMVEINPATDRVLRIFNKPSNALAFSPDVIRELPRWIAVHDVREQVFARAENTCDFCGATITVKTGEMHELISRSKGGEISLMNSRALCSDCHRNDKVLAHGKRKPQWRVRQ